MEGVPRQHRGEIWKLLSEQYNLRQQVPSKSPSTDTPYKDLLKQLTSQQHAILIDLGKCLDTHLLRGYCISYRQNPHLGPVQ